MRHHVGQPSIGMAEVSAVVRALESGRLTQGPIVADFEARLARYLEVREVVACSSGTAALHLALAALEVGPGDEVLVPDVTFVATANAVAYVGAKPVLVDSRRGDWCMDLKDAAKKVTLRTVAIIPVHVYGAACDPDAVAELADEHGLHIVEDTAEGLGGWHGGRALGTFGDAGVFSFYANKVMTTGEGGAVVTDDEGLAARLRLLRGQAQGRKRFRHEELGFNYRMTDIAAAIGVAQLDRLPALLESRARVVAAYRQALRGRVEFPEAEGMAPWLFTCLLPRGISRDAVAAGLESLGIETRPAFTPMHEQPMYQARASDFPVACDVAARGISLPTHPDLEQHEVREIAEMLLAAIAAQKVRT